MKNLNFIGTDYRGEKRINFTKSYPNNSKAIANEVDNLLFQKHDKVYVYFISWNSTPPEIKEVSISKWWFEIYKKARAMKGFRTLNIIECKSMKDAAKVVSKVIINHY